jgi:hypothetical protein
MRFHMMPTRPQRSARCLIRRAMPLAPWLRGQYAFKVVRRHSVLERGRRTSAAPERIYSVHYASPPEILFRRRSIGRDRQAYRENRKANRTGNDSVRFHGSPPLFETKDFDTVALAHIEQNSTKSPIHLSIFFSAIWRIARRCNRTHPLHFGQRAQLSKVAAYQAASIARCPAVRPSHQA